MTVCQRGRHPGYLLRVHKEIVNVGGEPTLTFSDQEGNINADLSIGADVAGTEALRANLGLSFMGVAVNGDGFLVTPAQAASLGLGRVPHLDQHIRQYLNGRDLTQRSRGMMAIDLFGLSEAEARQRFPDAYQHVLVHVKPSRDANRRDSIRELWWQFGWPRPELRRALAGLPRFIATVETSKHRVLCFLPAEVLPDNRLACVPSDDAFHLGALSSRLHVCWALASGGTLEDRPIYNKTRCFDPFPFPDATAEQRTTIAALAEELDALRRTRLDAHKQLTMTGLYNVLEKLRAAQPLTPAERDMHDAGHVSVLRRLHDELDAAVADAYGWPRDLPPAEIVERMVALNIARRAEEADGLVRWLRPAFQAPTEQRRAAQGEMAVPAGEEAGLPPWPARDPERFVALRAVLAASPGKPADLSRRFQRASAGKVRAMLETLAALGQARLAEDGRYHL